MYFCKVVLQFVCKFTQKDLYCKLFRVFFNFINCFIHFFIYINGEQLNHIERDQRKVDEANHRVIDWVLYGKR